MRKQFSSRHDKMKFQFIITLVTQSTNINYYKRKEKLSKK